MSTTRITKAMYFVAGAQVALGHVCMWDIEEERNVARHLPWCWSQHSPIKDGRPGRELNFPQMQSFEKGAGDYACVYDREDKHHGAAPVRLAPGAMDWLRSRGRYLDPASSDWTKWYRQDDPGDLWDGTWGANWEDQHWPGWADPGWGPPYVTAGGFGMWDEAPNSHVYNELHRDGQGELHRLPGARNARPRPMKATQSYQWSDLPDEGGEKEIALNFGTLHAGGWMKFHYCPYFDHESRRNSDEWLTCFRYNPVRFSARNRELGWDFERREQSLYTDMEWQPVVLDTFAVLQQYIGSGTRKLYVDYKTFVSSATEPGANSQYADISVEGDVLTFTEKSEPWEFGNSMTSAQFATLIAGQDMVFYSYRVLDRGYGWIMPGKLGWQNEDTPYTSIDAAYRFIIDVDSRMVANCRGGCTLCLRWDMGGGGNDMGTAFTFTSCVDIFTGIGAEQRDLDDEQDLDGDGPGCRCGKTNGEPCGGPMGDANDSCGAEFKTLERAGIKCDYDSDPWSCFEIDEQKNKIRSTPGSYPFGCGCGPEVPCDQCREPDCTNLDDCLDPDWEQYDLVDCGVPYEFVSRTYSYATTGAPVNAFPAATLELANSFLEEQLPRVYFKWSNGEQRDSQAFRWVGSEDYPITYEEPEGFYQMEVKDGGETYYLVTDPGVTFPPHGVSEPPDEYDTIIWYNEITKEEAFRFTFESVSDLPKWGCRYPQIKECPALLKSTDGSEDPWFIHGKMCVEGSGCKPTGCPWNEVPDEDCAGGFSSFSCEDRALTSDGGHCTDS